MIQMAAGLKCQELRKPQEDPLNEQDTKLLMEIGLRFPDNEPFTWNRDQQRQAASTSTRNEDIPKFTALHPRS